MSFTKRNKLIDKINSFKKLNDTMNKGHEEKSRFSVFLITIGVLLKSFFCHNFKKKTSSTIERHKNKYIITYYINESKYIIILPSSKMINKVLRASDENGNDITEILEEYIGPVNNFHGMRYYPLMLGFNKITIELDDGNIKVFEGRDIIDIS